MYISVNCVTLGIVNEMCIFCQHLFFTLSGAIFSTADSARGAIQQIPKFSKVSAY